MPSITRALVVLVTLAAMRGTAQDPRVEDFRFPSAARGAEVDVAVHLPAGYADGKSYPVIYFLHGAGRGSFRTWKERGADKILDRLVAEKKVPPVIVACPEGEMGFYINWKGEGQGKNAYGDMVTKDLVAFIDGKFKTDPVPGRRALLGDSMGGFGALVNAVRHPDLFGAVAAHEPSIFPEDRSQLPEWISRGRGGRAAILPRMFGDPVDEKHWLGHNVFHLVRTGDPKKLAGLAIYFDVGKNDRYDLAGPNQSLHALLKEKGIGHAFHLRDGGHGREFFVDNLPDSLTFLGKALSAAPASDAAAPR